MTQPQKTTRTGIRAWALGLAAMLVAAATAFTIASAGAVGIDCTMASVMPTAGSTTLEYVKPSTQNADRIDYKLTGTIRWDSQDALNCFKKGTVDWAFEQEIQYPTWFDRKIWGETFSMPSESHPYIDTTVSDKPGTGTGLSFGIFRPETLTAGVDYTYSYDLFLPDPPEGKQWIRVAGEVAEKQCSNAGPWCVGLRGDRLKSDAWIGDNGGFDAYGTTCWAWRSDGSKPVDCTPASASNSSEPATPTDEESAPVATEPLSFDIDEQPFICNDELRKFGTVSNAVPGELIYFNSPQAPGLVPGTADSSGVLGLTWSCSSEEAGPVTLNAESASGRTGSVTFDMAAPEPAAPTPPPDPAPAPAPAPPPSEPAPQPAPEPVPAEPTCSTFTVWAQNRWDPQGASLRAQPDHNSEWLAGFAGNAALTVDGWTHGSQPYPDNPGPFNNDVWYHLADGSGWVSFAAVRGGETSYDPNSGDGGPPAEIPSECEI